ncbi:MAG: hypothetical protein JWO48_2826 [Bryobacterales bacterium]|nr:hypothetical protein [Bryobacterales bacterium]
MRERTFFVALFLILLAARLCHVDILWAEEDLPMAAAAQMKFGKTLYRDAWFDKPPLLASIYLAWGVRAGWVLRLAGALYALLACALAYGFARDLWGRHEGLWAAGLLGFFLIFDFPSAVIPLAADLTMLAPHLAAVWLAFRGRAFWSGAAAGVAFLVNAKALFVLAACAVWCLPGVAWLVLGFFACNAVAAAWLAWTGALIPYVDEVWRWGFLYAGSTFLAHPVRTGVVRTAEWFGFHAPLMIAALWHKKAVQSSIRWKMLAWAALSLAATFAGWRFFPRYFFQLLPVMVIAASRGMVLMERKSTLALVLLLIPMIRFGPRYVLLARDLATGQPRHWNDVAMDQDSRAAADILRAMPHPGDTLFVWGFRPELFVYTGLPAATRFLDSQPLTGVPADRHLTQSAPVAADFTRANREELARSRPAFIMDGLSLYNPVLAIDRYPELRSWLAQYREVARTRTIVIYRLIEPAATFPSSRPRVFRETPRFLPARRQRASSWS